LEGRQFLKGQDNRMKLTCTLLLLASAVSLSLFGSGCSVKRIAANKVGDAVAGGGTTYAADDDPELVKAAAPFSLKLMESLLDQNPRHRALLLATTSSFTQYTFAFVQQEADEMEDKDVTRAAELRARARRLYLRARNYGLRGLEVEHAGFQRALGNDPKTAVSNTKTKDVPLLYWTAVSWAAAISVSKDDPELIGDLPKVEALVDRALELDESFDHGAIHTFLISYEMSRRKGEGEPAARARKHFDRALELSGGQMAGPMVSLAESVSVQSQNQQEFKSLLERALAINPDTKPEWRLANLVMQRRARWLLARSDELFLAPAHEEKATP
jgi:predicted anti-sigma-YlaC factor YlaD